jgi:mannose/fructose/N-acetylgalactosamine-specific phosphotransferase system component IIB
MTITRIGRDHIIISDDDINDDDYESRRRSRILPYNTLTVNKVNNKSNITALNASAGLQEQNLLICYMIKNYLLLSVQCAVM